MKTAIFFFFTFASLTVQRQSANHYVLTTGPDTRVLGNALASAFKKYHPEIIMSVRLNKIQKGFSIAAPSKGAKERETTVTVGHRSSANCIQLSYGNADQSIYTFIFWLFKEGQKTMLQEGLIPLDEKSLDREKKIIQAELSGKSVSSCDGIDAIISKRRASTKSN